MGHAIPAAFLSTFMLMQFAGLDLNMVTMSALILAIGLLVDDGIVVLENIHRHLTDRATTARDAAVTGTSEVLGAKLAGSLTTLGVLVPLIFMGGFIGELFRPLATTLAFALSSSFVVAVTLVPLMAMAWLKPRPADASPGRVAAVMDRAMRGVRRWYLAGLWGALRHPIATLGLALVLLVASFGTLRLVGSEMLPRFDSGSFQVLVDFVPGTPLEDTLAGLGRAEAVLAERPEVEHVGVRVGHERGARSLGQRGAMDINQAEITVTLVPRTARSLSQWQIMDEVRHALERTPGVKLGVPKEMGGTARGGTAAPIMVRVSGFALDRLDSVAGDLLEHLDGIPGITVLYKVWALELPEMQVVLDPERLGELGLSARQTAATVQQALDGRVATRLNQPRVATWTWSCATSPMPATSSTTSTTCASIRPRACFRSGRSPGGRRRWARASSPGKTVGEAWTCSATTTAGRSRPWLPMWVRAWRRSKRRRMSSSP